MTARHGVLALVRDTVLTAFGRSVAVAADATAGRAALGVYSTTQVDALVAGAGSAGRLSSRPASPAVGDRYYATDFDVMLGCHVAGTWGSLGVGPLAVTRGPFASAAARLYTAAGVAVGPTGGPGTTLAMGLHVTTLPGASEWVIAEYWANGSGWILGASGGGTANRLYLAQLGVSGAAKVELGDLTTGSFAVAVSIAPTALRWSIKGGAVGSVVVSGTYVPPASDATLNLGAHASGGLALTTAQIGWFQSWGSTLSDAALQAITAAHATYLPGEAGADSVAAYLPGRTRRSDLDAEAVGSQVAYMAVPVTLGWTAR